jgi:hypothetical protein
MKPNYQQMTDAELRAYIKENRTGRADAVRTRLLQEVKPVE